MIVIIIKYKLYVNEGEILQKYMRAMKSLKYNY